MKLLGIKIPSVIMKLCRPAQVYLVLSLISVIFYLASMFNVNDTIVEAEYQTSTGYHGMMEPMNMVAMETNGVWHLYTGTQWPSNMRDSAAAILEVDPKNVIVHQQYSGTGFGRRNEMDIAIVALAARAIGRPVKLCYTREQDIGFDYHQSQSVQRVKGSIKDGKINAMEHDVVTGWALERAAPGFMAESVDKKGKVDQFAVNGADHWYDIPNHYVRTANNYVIANASPSGFLRAVAPNWTWWANECFVDECAHKAGIDPLDMRLSMFNATGKNAGSAPNSIGGSHRLKNVLLIAAGKAGYGVKPMPENTAMGIAAVASQERGSPTWTAGIVEVHVDPNTGQPTVNKLTIAMDVGTAVNPDGVKAQIEGSSLYGLSRVLYEDITMKDGVLGGAALDVFEVEPATSNKLKELPNFISTPHMGAQTKEAQSLAANVIAEKIIQILRGVI